MLKDRKKDLEKDKNDKKQTPSAVAEFSEEANKYKEISGQIPKKGQGREEKVDPFSIH